MPDEDEVDTTPEIVEPLTDDELEERLLGKGRNDADLKERASRPPETPDEGFVEPSN